LAIALTPANALRRSSPNRNFCTLQAFARHHQRETGVIHQHFELDRIDRSAPHAMLAWARILGVSQSEILIAVAAVGDRADAVRTYLARPWPEPLA